MLQQNIIQQEVRYVISIILFIPFVLMAQNPVHTTGRGKYITTGRGAYQTQNPYVAPTGNGGGDTAQVYQDFMDSATVVLYANWDDVDTAGFLTKSEVLTAYHNEATDTYAFNGFGEIDVAADKTNYCVDDGNNRFHRSYQGEDKVDVYNSDPAYADGSGFMYHLKIPANEDTLYITTLFRWHNTEGDTIYNDRYDSGKIVPGFYANDYLYARQGYYDGFSLGNSWRDTIYGSPSYDNHGLSSYLYWGGQSGAYGDVSLCTDPETGDPINFDSYWHNFTWFVAMNNPGSGNGVIRGFYDGRLVKEITGLTLRTGSDRHIEWVKMYFTFGGNSCEQRSYKSHWLDVDETYVFYYDNDIVKDDYLTLPNWDINEDKPIFNGILTDNEKGTLEGEDDNPVNDNSECE